MMSSRFIISFLVAESFAGRASSIVTRGESQGLDGSFQGPGQKNVAAGFPNPLNVRDGVGNGGAKLVRHNNFGFQNQFLSATEGSSISAVSGAAQTTPYGNSEYEFKYAQGNNEKVRSESTLGEEGRYRNYIVNKGYRLKQSLLTKKDHKDRDSTIAGKLQEAKRQSLKAITAFAKNGSRKIRMHALRDSSDFGTNAGYPGASAQYGGASPVGDHSYPPQRKSGTVTGAEGFQNAQTDLVGFPNAPFVGDGVGKGGQIVKVDKYNTQTFHNSGYLAASEGSDVNGMNGDMEAVPRGWEEYQPEYIHNGKNPDAVQNESNLNDVPEYEDWYHYPGKGKSRKSKLRSKKIDSIEKRGERGAHKLLRANTQIPRLH